MKKRGKYSVRLQRRFNAIMKIWKRTERNNLKWKLAGKFLRVLKKNPKPWHKKKSPVIKKVSIRKWRVSSEMDGIRKGRKRKKVAVEKKRQIGKKDPALKNESSRLGRQKRVWTRRGKKKRIGLRRTIGSMEWRGQVRGRRRVGPRRRVNGRIVGWNEKVVMKVRRHSVEKVVNNRRTYRHMDRKRNKRYRRGKWNIKLKDSKFNFMQTETKRAKALMRVKGKILGE